MTTNSTSSSLTSAPPSPGPFGLVVYDGTCNFCLRQIEKFRRRDDRASFAFTPKQTPGLLERHPALAEGDFSTGLRLIEPDGRVQVGADAIYRIARHLRGYRRLAWLYRVPLLHSLLRAAYGWVARNRYRLAGRCETGACDISPPGR